MWAIKQSIINQTTNHVNGQWTINWFTSVLGTHQGSQQPMTRRPAHAMQYPCMCGLWFAAGLGPHASLAESLANGTVPAKANNFTQLQQHIDDLTKEKFELVRGLKEQQKMAAGLSEENLLLTEDFNRQVICRPVAEEVTTHLVL